MNSAWILIKSDFSRTVTATPDDQLLFFATNDTLDSFFPWETFSVMGGPDDKEMLL